MHLSFVLSLILSSGHGLHVAQTIHLLAEIHIVISRASIVTVCDAIIDANCHKHYGKQKQ